MIPFNKPFLAGNELEYIKDAVLAGKISGDGKYTRLSQSLLEKKYSFTKALLTTSCTDALEMAAILCDIKPGDEVILPSFSFVSAANAFLLRGAVPRFADIQKDTFNIDPAKVGELVNKKTKAIVVVHYAGVACDMNAIMEIAKANNLFVIEDAALAIDSFYLEENGNKKPLASIGHFGTFSFHETKNIISGEGGALIINDTEFIQRAEIIREKGTDRARLFRGEIDKYTWQDIGSSFLPADTTAAYLYAQLENIDTIQQRRIKAWDYYYNSLSTVTVYGVSLPFIPRYATLNAQMFYLLCNSEKERDSLLRFLNLEGIKAVFHYLPLHQSPFYLKNFEEVSLPVTENISERIVRLPLFYDITEKEQNYIAEKIFQFYSR